MTALQGPRCGRLLLAGLVTCGYAGADAGTDADAGAAARWETCVEHVPEGKARPKLEESLPASGISGHALRFEIVIEHGSGETILPAGLRFREGSSEGQALERAFFVIPDPDGGAGPRLTTTTNGDVSKTTLELFVVPLPDKPGRQELTLPPLPIAIERASGEQLTVCTSPQRVTLEDPTANTPDAKPKPNPDPRRQLEVWTTAKHITAAVLTALAVAALVAWLLRRWLARPRVAPAGPPARPPWELALEELRDLDHRGLIERELFVEHFERVSFVLRRYCGERYGFDGLESTTREMLGGLRRIVPPVPVLPEIETFLREADLVKFARLTPSSEECATALARAREIVERTIPPIPTPTRSPAHQERA